MTSQVREALTALGASPFIQKVIDPVLVELQRRYAPLVRSIPSQRWTTDVYNFNQRTTVPGGGFVVDGGSRPLTSSTYVQNSVQMKHILSVGAVTGYAEAITSDLIGSLRRTEIMGATQGFYWDVETGICWGNAASTMNGAQPQYDGLDTLVSDFTSGYFNSVDFAHGTFSLGTMDKLIDIIARNAKVPVENSNWQFVLSTTAKSKVSQLLVNQQRFEQVEIAAGLVVDTYRNIPMVPTSFLSPAGYAMGAVTATTATTGGSIPASTTFYYKVAPVISRQGEALPSGEVSQATGSGTGTNIITLAFTPPTGEDGLSAQLYKVYRGTASGSESFLGYVDASVGLMSDGVTPIPTTSIIDTGTALVPQNGSTVPGTLPTAYYGTNANLLPPAAGDESIYLISRVKNNVVRPYVREARPLDVYPTTASPDSLPYALIGDTCFAVRASRFVARAARVAVSLTS